MPRRSRRVTIVSRIYRPEPAAAALWLGAVADELIARGFDVDVITVTPPPGLRVVASGERVRTWPVLRDKSGYVRGYAQYLSFDVPLFLRLLVSRRPDVVLVEPPPTTGAVVRVVSWLRRIPYVYDAADIWSDAASMATSSDVVVRSLRRVEQFAARGAAHIVTISTGVMDRLTELRVAAPATVTGFGADTSTFSRYDETVTPVFVYVGSYSPWHGADVALRAFADFSTERPEFRLRFIGNGERELLQALARELRVEDRVDFSDPVPAEDAARILSAATASIATLKPNTGYEYAFTSKAYSALASGCPVLFAGPGPTATFLEEASRTVRAGYACEYDSVQLTDAMHRIAASPASTEERDALAAWTRAHHSLSATAARVAAVLEHVIDNDQSDRETVR